MAAVYAVPSDIADRWRPLSADETAVATVLLDDASRKMRLASPGLDTRIAASADLAAEATYVAASMVKRVLQNPEGYREVSIDDYRRVRDAVLSAGLLYVDDDEIAALASGAILSGGPYVVPLGG